MGEKSRRVNLRQILADPELRRELMVPTIQSTQAREGIDTTKDQAERAYYVVTEGERSAFLDLEQHRGGKGLPDRRHEVFVQSLGDVVERVRFDVPRRDFGAIEGSPLAYRRVGLVAHIFREAQPLEPNWGVAVQGLATAADARFVRNWWEVANDSIGKDWIPFAKGGEFSRFYADVYLVVHWTESSIAVMKATGRVQNVDYYFKRGLTWPLRTQRGLNVRCLPHGCIFSHKGPAILPSRDEDQDFVLGIVNSAVAEYLLQGLMSFGSWEVGVIKRLPVAQPTAATHDNLSRLTRQICRAKASWDEGNELSTAFSVPWLLRSGRYSAKSALPDRLASLADHEEDQEVRIQQLYAQLNEEVCRLYGVPSNVWTLIQETLGDRPPEIIWPQMERKTPEQKRMEHVWRLLSYLVKCVVEADKDGIVSFESLSGETPLVGRLRQKLAQLLPDQDLNLLETELTNELKRKVKGYRQVASIEDWLESAFFPYHVSLYKKRPIFWHIASSRGRGPAAFSALVHYHRFDHDRMAKLRGTYLRDALQRFRREAGLAQQEGREEDRQEWQEKLEEAEELDRRLQWIQEGSHEPPAEADCRILTPWKSEAERPKGWDPDLDDGVAVNIAPLQRAGVLRIVKVV